MTNQEQDKDILNNAPELSIGIDERTNNYVYHLNVRSLADIRELVKLRAEVAELQERIANASDVAANYAYIDGAHHKNWVINEMLCAIQTEDELIGNGWKDADWLEECIAP
jgi:hypothetical protein